MNFITSLSNFILRFPWHFEISLRRLLQEDYFLQHAEMDISEFAYLECGEAFEKFLATCSSSKNTGLPQFFFKVFWQLRFKNISFLTKTKRCWLLWIMMTFMNSKLPDKLVVFTSKTKFSKKVNPMKYSVQTNILVRTWNFLFMYFTGISH